MTFTRSAARPESIMAQYEYDPCCASTGAPSPLSGHVGAARCCFSRRGKSQTRRAEPNDPRMVLGFAHACVLLGAVGACQEKKLV